MAVKFNDESFALKYLFRAKFNDGTFFQQNSEDVSLKDPKRSAFTDLLEEQELHGGIKLFLLEGEGHTYLVDLKDGHFEIDGVPFSVGENMTLPNRELIYFRQHQHDTIVDMKMQSTGKGEHRLWYFIGWQSNVGGKNYQQTINVRQLTA